MDRDAFQDRLSAANPSWKAYIEELDAAGQRPRTNPDGDVSPFDLSVAIKLTLVIIGRSRGCRI